LQWGPSFIYSPSNPFFSDNGRSNPFMEVPGMDFVRLIVIPHSIWTISFIVNTDEGRNTLLGTDPFKTSVAAKIDFTGRKNYASIIFQIETPNLQQDFSEVGLFPMPYCFTAKAV